MQAGYRTDPIYSAKALKASLKTRKLDNAVYGSDLKFQNAINAMTGADASTQTVQTQTQGQTPVIDTSLPHIALGESAFSPGIRSVDRFNMRSPYSPVSNSVVSSIPAAPPRSTVSSSTSSMASALSNELLRTIHSGITPSEIRKSKQKTSVGAVSLPVSQISTSHLIGTPSPVGSATSSGPQRLETKTEVPTSMAPQATPVNTSSEAISTKEALGPFPGATETFNEATNLIGTKPSLNDINLQKLASMIMVVSKGEQSSTIPAYDKNGVESDDKIRIAKAGDGYSFTLKRKAPKEGENKTALLKEAPSEGIDIAKTLTMGYDALVQHRGIVGIGLDREERKKVHWAHNRSHSDRNFVMYPAFRNGNIRFYVSPKHQAVVSYNNASPHFLNIVRDVIDTGTFKTSDYATLTPAESTAAHTFIKWAKPIIPRGAQFNTTDAGELFDMRNRYKVLVGELAAGNHGQAIKDEMMDILHTLQAKGALSRFKVNGLIKGLAEL